MSRRDAAQRKEFGLPLSKGLGTVAAPPVIDAGEETVVFTMGAAIAVPAPITTNYTPQPGDSLTIIAIQDATAGRALTWNAIYRGSPAATGGAATAGQRMLCEYKYDGASWQYAGGATTFA